MPMFKVVVKREFVEYGTANIEADDASEAREQVMSDVDLFVGEWSQQELEEETFESCEEA